MQVIIDEREIVMEPKAILETRWVKKGSRFIEESLVKWLRLSAEDATCKNTEELWKRFHILDIEDKDLVKEGGGGY